MEHDLQEGLREVVLDGTVCGICCISPAIIPRPLAVIGFGVCRLAEPRQVAVLGRSPGYHFQFLPAVSGGTFIVSKVRKFGKVKKSLSFEVPVFSCFSIALLLLLLSSAS